MNKLFVEELESRNLLNAGGFGHESLHWLRPDRTDSTELVHSTTPRADYRSYDRVDRDFGSANDWSGRNPGANFGRGGQIPVAPADSARQVIRQATGPAVSDVGSNDYQGGQLGATGSAMMIVEQGYAIIVVIPDSISVADNIAVPAASLSVPFGAAAANRAFGPADSPVETSPSQFVQRIQTGITLEQVSSSTQLVQVETSTLPRGAINLAELAVLSTSGNGTSAGTANTEPPASAALSKISSPIPHADNLPTTALRVAAAGFVTDAGIVRDGSEIGPEFELPIPRPQLAQPVPQLSSGGLSLAPSAQAIRASLAALPQFADLMNGFSAVELTRIEQGITNFLNRLETTPSLAISKGEADLYPWIIAGVATVAACEMARRQLKRTSARGTLNLLALSTRPWDATHEHQHG